MDLAASLTSEEDGTKMWGTLIPNWEMNLGAIPQGTYLDSEDLTYTKKEMQQILHRLYVDDQSAPGLGAMQSGSFDVYAYFESGNYYTIDQRRLDLPSGTSGLQFRSSSASDF